MRMAEVKVHIDLTETTAQPPAAGQTPPNQPASPGVAPVQADTGQEPPRTIYLTGEPAPPIGSGQPQLTLTSGARHRATHCRPCRRRAGGLPWDRVERRERASHRAHFHQFTSARHHAWCPFLFLRIVVDEPPTRLRIAGRLVSASPGSVKILLDPRPTGRTMAVPGGRRRPHRQEGE